MTIKVADQLAKIENQGRLLKKVLGKAQFKNISGPLAWSRLLDNGEDAKVKGTRKVGGAGSPQIPPV